MDNGCRVVVTGMGVVSSIGRNKEEVLSSLMTGRTGIRANTDYLDLGLNTGVEGAIDVPLDECIPRKWLRFMGASAAYNYIAMEEAINDAGLVPSEVSHPRTGIIVGSGGASTANVSAAVDLLRKKGIRKVGPYMVPRTMSSTNSACLSTAFKILGVSYSISSACSTSAHCIVNAIEQIRLGNQDIMFAGGGEEVHWTMTLLFDAMGALSTKYNATPELASRPYDVNRDGFVISGGGGVLVLEELNHAKARGARIYAEIVGYGSTSDGCDMVQPSGEGAERCMLAAISSLKCNIDYINAHGTGTKIGDVRELEVIKKVFSEKQPYISSTKSTTGHALGASGVHEAIYSILMLKGKFIAPSANIQELDALAYDLPIVRNPLIGEDIRTVMSNSFGFGGSNVSLVFQDMH